MVQEVLWATQFIGTDNDPLSVTDRAIGKPIRPIDRMAYATQGGM
jgi:hypothetical protein